MSVLGSTSSSEKEWLCSSGVRPGSSSSSSSSSEKGEVCVRAVRMGSSNGGYMVSAKGVVWVERGVRSRSSGSSGVRNGGGTCMGSSCDGGCVRRS